MKQFFAILLFIACFTDPSYGQWDPEILRRAKNLGINEQQLQDIFSSGSGNRLTAGSVTENREEADRYSILPKAGVSTEPADSIQKPAVFGQALFRNKRLSFVSEYNIPTPDNYVLGAGDEVIVDVWGDSELHFKGKISPEGTAYLPNVGPVHLSGYTIGEAGDKIRDKLRTVIGNIGNGSRLKVSLGEMRSVRVHVVGDVLHPGTYTLPSLASVFHALYQAGGPEGIGSLRDIRLIRNRETVSEIDVYELLVQGRSESNVGLREGDVILVPPYHTRVHISGEVKREDGYELRPGEKLADLLRFCGGFRGEAYREQLTVLRKSGRQYHIHTVEENEFGCFDLQDGDSVIVDRIIDLYANRLTIKGAVWRPGEYEYRSETKRLSGLIAQAGSLKGDEFSDRGQIVRLRPDFTTEVIPFSLRAVLLQENDIELQPEDEVYIPSLGDLTERLYILVRGEVNRPDTLEFRYRMTVEDAVLLAGGLKESASSAQVAVARRLKNPGAETYSGQIAETFSFDVSPDLSLPGEGGEFLLQPFDEVYIRRSPVYYAQQGALVTGEILFNGNYAFSRAGERLSELVAKAGGVTPEAYIKGASLTRTMTVDEKAKLESKLAMAQAASGRDSLDLRTLQLTTSYSVGIDLEKALREPAGIHDIVLRDGDVIHIPKYDNTVKISGSVLHTNTVTFEGGRLNDYISQAGGYTDGARRRPFIVYMNGKVASTRRGFLHKRYPRVEPGCEIIVPEKNRRSNRNGIAEALQIASSSTAIAAMIATLLK